MDKHAQYKAERMTILKALYSAREDGGRKSGWLTMYELRQLVGECAFSLEYLVEKNHIRADGNRYRITAPGMDKVEAA